MSNFRPILSSEIEEKILALFTFENKLIKQGFIKNPFQIVAHNYVKSVRLYHEFRM